MEICDSKYTSSNRSLVNDPVNHQDNHRRDHPERQPLVEDNSFDNCLNINSNNNNHHHPYNNHHNSISNRSRDKKDFGETTDESNKRCCQALSVKKMFTFIRDDQLSKHPKFSKQTIFYSLLILSVVALVILHNGSVFIYFYLFQHPFHFAIRLTVVFALNPFLSLSLCSS